MLDITIKAYINQVVLNVISSSTNPIIIILIQVVWLTKLCESE